MRKNFGAKPYAYPQAVFIIASYDENNVPDAMNAAWGSMCDMKGIAMYLSHGHKTVKNILNKKAFTVSMATEDYIIPSDYVGIVSGNKVANKLEKSGFHTVKSDFVDAPVITELPLTLECKLTSYDPDTELLTGEIVNVSAEDTILDENGMIDPQKLKPIIFDAANSTYLGIGKTVGKAFEDGKKLI